MRGSIPIHLRYGRWALLVLLALAPDSTITAQAPPPTLALGWGVDTTTADRAAVVRRWAAYLADHPESPHPNAYWSPAEQQRWPDFDFTARVVYQGFSPTLIELTPVTGRGDSAFVLKTLYASADSAGVVRPLALQRVYAVREEGRWVLANAFPRLTREWRRTVAGPITYLSPPDAPRDTAAMSRAQRFVSDVADAFGVPVRPITYLVARDPEELARVLGLDWYFAPRKGLTLGLNGLILSSSPTYGAAHLHELVHILVTWLPSGGAHNHLMNEGVSAWLGGSDGRTFSEFIAALAAAQRARPALRLMDAAHAHGADSPLFYATGALFCALAYERGGMAAVQTLLTIGPDDAALQAGLQRLFRVDAAELERLWRTVPARWVRNAPPSPLDPGT